MQELADVEDAATEAAFNAAQAGDQVPPPVTTAQPPVIQEPPVVSIPVDDTCATRFVVNDGQGTQEEHEQVLRKAAQGIKVHYWNREA